MVWLVGQASLPARKNGHRKGRPYGDEDMMKRTDWWKTSVSILVLALCLAAGCNGNDKAPAPEPLDPHAIYDRDGREVILHGGNFMGIEYNGVQADYDQMVWQWGFNTVRILITWADLEPEQGVYDERYLPDVVEPQLDYAYRAGLLPILDMHQFKWSDCCDGMGMPVWTCADLPESEIEYILQAGVFWQHPEYVAAFVAAWEKVAAYFADDERVFAYDLFNEPLAGLRTPPWFSENQLYRPLYMRLIDVIRPYHQEAYLIVEPTIIHGAGFPCVMDPIDAERLIYGPHLYPGRTSMGGGYTFDKSLIARHLDKRRAEACRLGMPLFIGETGLRSDTENSEGYARDATELMDMHKAHWAWWAYGYDEGSMGICHDNGEPKEAFFEYLSRPYPRATAGSVRTYIFDPDSDVFTFTFANDRGMAPGSEIYVNAGHHYPGGFGVTCTDPNGAWEVDFDPETNLLTVACDPKQAEHTITIRPAKNGDTTLIFP